MYFVTAVSMRPVLFAPLIRGLLIVFCGFSVENKFSLFCEQRCILYQHSVLQPCYCFGLILMKLGISNVLSPNDAYGVSQKRTWWHSFVFSFDAFECIESSLYTPQYVIMTNYQTSWYSGYHELFLFGNFTVRPSTGRLKNVSFIASRQMEG